MSASDFCDRHSRVLTWSIATLSAGLFAAISLEVFAHLQHLTTDLAVFTQAVRGYAALQAPIADIKAPGFNLLGDHFSPVHALLAPFWHIWPSPAMLDVAQALLFGLSVVPIARAGRRLGSLPALALAAAYGISFGLQNAARVDYHEIAFAVPLLAFSLEAYLNERWRLSVLYAAPLVLVKEDMGLTVAMLGLLLVLRRQWLLGAVTAVGGIVATLVATFVVVPAFNPSGKYPYFTNLGTSDTSTGLAGTWSRVVDDPGALVANGDKWLTVAALLAVSAGFVLWSRVSLMLVPTLLWRFTSDIPFHWGPHWHYDAILMPIAFVALIDGASRLRRSPRSYLRAWSAAAVPLAVGVSVVLLPWLPVAHIVDWPPGTDERVQGAAAADDAVPLTATVASDRGLLHRLAASHTTYFVERTGNVIPDYIVLDSTFDGPSVTVDDLAQYVQQLLPGARYEVASVDPPFVVFHRSTGP